MEATVNTTDKTAIDLHSTRIILRHIFLHTFYCMNQRYNWQVTDLKTVFQLYSFIMLFSPSVFYFTDDTPCVSKARIKLYQITDNGCFATRHPKHKPKTEINPPPKKNTVGSHDSNNTVGADATQASPSRHVHHRTSANVKLWHQTAELANHSRAWEQVCTRT